MCIAIYSLRNTDVPSQDILRNCFDNNPDGAGFAFNNDKGKVQIVKGLMNWESFISTFNKYNSKFGFKKRGVLIHFRIATQGGVSPSCCHPFPITSSEKNLKKTKCTVNYAAIHNGIISLTSKKGEKMSDTMFFIKDYLSKISSNKNWFYNPINAELIYELIDSKMAILNGYGNIMATEGFKKGKDGNYYSNNSYKNIYDYYDYGIYEDLLYDNYYSKGMFECPLMRLKKDEMLCYGDCTTEDFDSSYHDVYPIYLTREGDIYADYENIGAKAEVQMDSLTYLGSGTIVSKLMPFEPLEFRKDAVGLA